MELNVNAGFPEKMRFLFESTMPDGVTPIRYKVLHGGRGGAKSHSIAKALLLEGTTIPLRVLCAREFQNSIRDSVHRLLSDQVNQLGLNGTYDVQQASIIGTNGTEFSFEGIRHNVAKVKSYEGVDRCWVEEAVNVSKNSWDVLIPTIRKDGSQIIVSFNPELDTDETYRRFVVNPPDNAWVEKVDWRDNPWFPEVLRMEMEDLKKRDYDAYLNVWEGQCRQMLEGAVYATELRAAQVEGRITRVPYDHTKPVDTFWDLGFADMTSIWFAQVVGFDYRIIDYYQNSLKSLDFYLKVLQRRNYVYGTDYLPWDAKAKNLGTGRSIEEIMRAAGRKVLALKKLSVLDGITATRAILPQCYFDQERCEIGLQALRHYRFEKIAESGSFSKNPCHDEHSHGADAFRTLAMGLKAPKEARLGERLLEGRKSAIGLRPWTNAALGWMSR